MTSDVKFSHDFFLIKINRDVFLTVKSFIKLLRLSTHHCKLFFSNLNVLEFELQCEWTASQKFFCRYSVLQLLCRNVERAHDIKCSQEQLELKFSSISEDLVLILSPKVFYKKGVLENFAILTGKHLCQSHFLNCNSIRRENLAHGFSCEFCKIFQSIFFTEPTWMTASILQQFLALYLATVCGWELSSSEKVLVGEKIIYTSQGFYTFRQISFFYFLFFLFLCVFFSFHFL